MKVTFLGTGAADWDIRAYRDGEFFRRNSSILINDDLLVDPNALPEGDHGKLEKAMTKVSEKALKRKANKNVILGLSSTLVWFIALLVFVVISSFDLPYSWLAFLYAVPVNAIVLLSLRSAWRDFRWNRVLISMISWGFLVSIYATLLVFLRFNIWRMFLLGIPGEIAITLWFRLFRPEKDEAASGE